MWPTVVVVVLVTVAWGTVTVFELSYSVVSTMLVVLQIHQLIFLPARGVFPVRVRCSAGHCCRSIVDVQQRATIWYRITTVFLETEKDIIVIADLASMQ